MGSAVAMARANPRVIVHAIDIGWLGWLDEHAHPALAFLSKKYPGTHFSESSAREIRKEQLKLVPNLEWHQGWSRSFRPEKAPGFCFIDGDHSTSAVVADFFHCWDIAEKGAIIAGHDFQLESVKKAVSKIQTVLNLEPKFANSHIWFWEKSDTLA